MTSQVLNNRIEQLMQCFRERLHTQICHPWYPPPVHLPCEPQHSQDNSNDWCQCIFNFETMPTLVAHLTIIRLHTIQERFKITKVEEDWLYVEKSQLEWTTVSYWVLWHTSLFWVKIKPDRVWKYYYLL